MGGGGGNFVIARDKKLSWLDEHVLESTTTLITILAFQKKRMPAQEGRGGRGVVEGERGRGGREGRGEKAVGNSNSYSKMLIFKDKRETDRQTDRDRQIERQTERETDRQTDRDRQIERQRETQTDRQTDRDREKERDRDRERERNRQTEREEGERERAAYCFHTTSKDKSASD